MSETTPNAPNPPANAPAKCRRRGRGAFFATLGVAALLALGASQALGHGPFRMRSCGHLDAAQVEKKIDRISGWIVEDLDGAIDHINTYGTGHTESIVTTDLAAAERFTEQVDAAAVMVNASTAFTDGEQFGFGAEIGISTQKLHARGPMGLPELTSTKWIVFGDGHTRPA